MLFRSNIARRFLPEYLRIFALAEDKVAKDAAYEAKIAANLQRLAKATGTHVSTEAPNGRGEVRKNFTWKLRDNYHTVTASAKDCSLTLDNLTLEQAEKVIAILK